MKNGISEYKPFINKIKDTPWGKYLVCVFKRLVGKQLTQFEYSDEIVFGLGKTLGKLHEYSSEFNCVKKQSCFDIIDEMIRTANNKLTDNRDIVLARIEEVNHIFHLIPQNKSNFGFIHFDFELDNVFYDDISKKYSIIDFGSSMYHWYIMDIEKSLNNLKEEFPQIDFEHLKAIFLNGYMVEYLFSEADLQWFSALRLFDDLCRYLNLKEVTEETWENEPEWMCDLRKELNDIMSEIESKIL